LAKLGAERSDDFNKIPCLREPYKPNKKIERFHKKIEKNKNKSRNKSVGMRKYATSIMESGQTGGKDSYL